MYDREYLASDADTTPVESPKRVEEAPEGDEKGKLWELNHKKIVEAISDHMAGYRNSAPSVTDLARKTGLSRQTIYSHLREYNMNPVHRARTQMVELMQFDVMMKLCSSALSGNFYSMRLYLMLTGAFNQTKTKKG